MACKCFVVCVINDINIRVGVVVVGGGEAVIFPFSIFFGKHEVMQDSRYDENVYICNPDGGVAP